MNTFLPVSPTFEKNHLPPSDHRTGRSLLQPNSVSDFFPGVVREQQQQHQQQHQRNAFFFAQLSPHRVRLLVNGKHKFVASTDGCVSVADFVSKKLKDIEVLRGKEVKVTLGDDFELIGSSPISILGQDECVSVKTIDRKGEEERFYSDASESAKRERRRRRRRRDFCIRGRGGLDEAAKKKRQEEWRRFEEKEDVRSRVC